MAGLLERDAELERIGDALDDALAGRGELLVVRGTPGIGKTRLIEEAKAGARRRGLGVLSAAGGELEQEFPYGVVRQLFDPVLAAEPDTEELLEGAARLALPALSFAPAGEAVPSEPSILHGLYWLVAGLAARGPLMIVIDDLHWADSSSLRFLSYLSRRSAELPIAIVVAARTWDPSAPEVLIAELTAERPVLELAPLSEAAVARLIAAALNTDADTAFASAVREASGGNPFLTAELIRAVAAEGVAPTAQGVTELDRLVIAGVDRSVQRRLGRLGPDAVTLARAAAVLGENAALRHAAALADLVPRRAAAAADALAAADILEAGTPLRFAHALVRARVLGALSAAEHGVLRARAARLLHDDGAPAAGVSAHLLASEPDADPLAVEILRQAARDAMAKGAPEPAVKLLRRALAEPPSRELRGDVVLELGLAEVHIDSAASAEHLRAAMTALGDAGRRSTAALTLAQQLVILMRPAEAVKLLLSELDEAERSDRELALRIAAQLAVAARVSMGESREVQTRIERLAEGAHGTTEGERRLRGALMDRRMGTGHSAEDTAALAMELLDGVGSTQAWRPIGPEGTAMVSLIIADRLEDTVELIEGVAIQAQQVGSAVGYMLASGLRGLCRLQQGSLPSAEADLRAAVDLGRAFEQQFPPTVGSFVEVLVERGEVVEADALMVETGLFGAVPRVMLFSPLLYSRAVLRRAQGRIGEAIEDARESGARYLESGMTRPVPPWRSLLALLLAEEQPEEALALAREEMDVAEDWGTPRSIGVAMHRLGVVERGVLGEQRIRDAVTVLEASPARLELARALVDLGRAVRRRRALADARPWLERGMDLASACGATVLAELARTELAATGVRPRRAARSGRDALTASELRVVELAAGGMTNRAIAQALFVTQSTVETHLGHAYQKLGHSSRDRLGKDLRVPV